MPEERREYQRLNLTHPADGWLGDFSIRLLDISATGALIETDDEIETGARALLRFWWRDEEVEITSDVIRTNDDRVGLRFVEDSPQLRRLIADSATELLRAQEANATGDRERNIVGDATLTAASSRVARTYLMWTLSEDGAWTHHASLVADQPPNGFTVSSAEAPDQVAMLCSTYQSGDDEARRLIRMLAELSVAESR